jgi:proline dehydrogenase
MMRTPRALMRDARYAFPEWVGRLAPGPGPASAARRCKRLGRKGLAASVGYFHGPADDPEAVVAAHRAVAERLAGLGDVDLSVKAPPLGFDAGRIEAVAQAAADAGLALTFDAHAPGDADPTLERVSALLGRYPRTGLALPARWRRSLADATLFREGPARIRIVKGEWPDPNRPGPASEADYLALVARLAGRSAPVTIATHDPALAEHALGLLLAAGTPCELEQLRGLPRRRTLAVARRLGVPVRIYCPFGPGWWPYAIDQALARPYLPLWALQDLLGSTAEPRGSPPAAAVDTA